MCHSFIVNYNIWNAIAYEICQLLIQHDPEWRKNFIVKKILSHSFLDWVNWRTDKTMKTVDHQVKQIHFELDAQDEINRKNQIIYTEHEPNDSEAQQLLGGAIEIQSAWSNHKRSEY